MRPPLPPRIIRSCLSSIRPMGFKPDSENALSNQIALWLKAQVEEKEKPLLFFHIPNEQARNCSIQFTKKLLHIGIIPGAPDFVIFLKKQPLFLEVKSSHGRLSPMQNNFCEWAEFCHIPYRVAYDFQEFLDIMDGYFHLS
jgi:rhamnose utilization protein RhaD (predicted bifunctional aldolase and dehydrogenase)